MQRILLSLLLLLAGAGLYAQAPSGFKFQAVARDADNNAMATDNIAVRVSLLRGGPSGAVDYSERHEVTTTDLGVFDLHIGNGVSLSGDMTTIDWGGDNYFLKIDIDPDGGSSYVNLGASQLLSVPYAMYANEAGNGGGGGDPTDELQNLIYDPTTQTLTLTDGNSVTLQVGGSGMPQTLTFNNSTRMLTISDGNTIEIPGGATGPQGPAGPAGDTGPAGPAGPEGPAGPAGADGTGISLLGTVATVANLPAVGNTQGDLYIVTADGNGYAWDGSMWNNAGPIQGPAGPAGPAGDAGPAGPTGPQGDSGPAGPAGSAGPQGPQGNTGPAGPTGPAGMDGQDGTGISLLGTVPNVGDLPGAGNTEGDLYIVSASGDGYAWDGSMWTNVGPIQGPTGPQGPQGPQGDQGPAGTNGIDGTNGAVGPQGPQGNPGPAGPQGPAGMDGIDGAVGPKGDQGDPGPAGPQGNPGPIGPKGDQGDAGPAGPVGPQGPTGPAGDLELPYYDEDNTIGAAFHVQNDFNNGRYGIAGSVGTNAETLPANNAGVLGQGVGGHGVYGVSKTSFFAGVQGVSESTDGVGVQGYGFGGGVGGHFYTTSSGVAALTTGRGNVGIGVDEPEMKMHVAGHLFVQTNLGDFVMGFPNNGNQWQFSTRSSGADLQLQHKESGTNNFDTRFRFRQNGEFEVGDVASTSAWMHVRNNSTIFKPQLKLEEVGSDYARLELTNTTSGGAFWHVAGLPSATAASARLNFYFRNANGAADRMTITGDGEVGINGSPTARLELFQGGQSVGSGLRFDDGTANSDWDITHGFALRFHYGGSLRGFINATTGAYTQSSDKTLKANVNLLSPVLSKVNQLAVKTYHYKSDKTKETTIGLLAQEAQELFPELVSYSEADKLYGVNYAGFSMVAIKAIQEQQAVIDAQEDRIESLEARLARLETLLSVKDK